MGHPSALPFQFSLKTAKSPEEILDDITQRRLAGIGIAERGSNYIVLRPRRRYRYGPDIAIGLCIAILFAILIATAFSVIFLILLPVAVLPALPLIFDDRPSIAISAIPDIDNGTRVMAHGKASAELAASLDAYLGSLPPAPTLTSAPSSGDL